MKEAIPISVYYCADRDIFCWKFIHSIGKPAFYPYPKYTDFHKKWIGRKEEFPPLQITEKTLI
jgi:hypothetical protein